MYRLKRSLFIAVVLALLVPMGMVNAQDVTTVTMWFDEGTTLDCWGPIMESFNEVDPSIQLEIVPQANSWDVTRTAVAGGGDLTSSARRGPLSSTKWRKPA